MVYRYCSIYALTCLQSGMYIALIYSACINVFEEFSGTHPCIYQYQHSIPALSTWRVPHSMHLFSRKRMSFRIR